MLKSVTMRVSVKNGVVLKTDCVEGQRCAEDSIVLKDSVMCRKRHRHEDKYEALCKPRRNIRRKNI